MNAKVDSTNLTTSFRVTLDGTEHEVDYQPGQVLLDCMLDAGLDPAFQCQQGHCGSCMAVKLCGDLEMRNSDALSRRDLEQGYILLCQTVPLSTDVWVDCDA